MGKKAREKRGRNKQKKKREATMLEQIISLVHNAEDNGLSAKEFETHTGFPMKPGTAYSSAVLVNAQNVADYFWEHEKVNWDLRDYNSAPLYPNLWIEYQDADERNFSEIIRTGKDSNGELDPRYIEEFKKNAKDGKLKLSSMGLPVPKRGAFITTFERDAETSTFLKSLFQSGDTKQFFNETQQGQEFMRDIQSEDYKWFTRSLIFISVSNRPPILLGTAYHLTQADGTPLRGVWHMVNGLLEKCEKGEGPVAIGMQDKDGNQTIDAKGTGKWLNELMMEWHNVPLLSLTFAHCKNVTITADPYSMPVKRDAKFSLLDKRALRVKPVPHVININPMRQVLRRETGSSRLSKASLQIVRGHFKHYGEEGRGLLFGKYAGNFFIESHVRGEGGDVPNPSYKITGL